MFVGNNSMELNEATMMLILQYYFDNKLLNKDEAKPKVKGVKAGANGYAGSTFTVTFEQAEPV